jgi:hypothetical protein
VRFSHLVWFISAAAFAASFAGCSDGSSQPASAPGAPPQSVGGPILSNRLAFQPVENSVALPQARHEVRGDTKPTPFVNVPGIESSGRNLLALSDRSADDVFILGARGFYAMLTTGLSQPQGLAFDTTGTLYIANTNDSQVLEYRKPYTRKSATLSDSGQYPAGVAVASDGAVGVTNIISTAGGPGSVSVYAKGATTPCATVSNSSFARVYFDAFDNSGNLYVDGTDASEHFVVGEVTGECAAPSIAPLSIRNTDLQSGRRGCVDER